MSFEAKIYEKKYVFIKYFIFKDVSLPIIKMLFNCEK